MSLVRWDPFADMAQLRDQVNRLFEQSLTASGREPASMRTWAPTVDIAETADAMVIFADLSGVNADDISIQMEGDTLTIRGERRAQKDDSDKRFVRIERSYGAFQRSFTLGVPIKQDEVTARYRDGILEVTLPKAEEVKPKQIPVQVETTLTTV